MFITESIGNYKRYRKSRRSVFQAIEEISRKSECPSITYISCIKSCLGMADSQPLDRIHIILETGSERIKDKKRCIFESIKDYTYEKRSGRFVTNSDASNLCDSLEKEHEGIHRLKKVESHVNIEEDTNSVSYDLIKKHSDNWYSLHREVDFVDDMDNKIYEYDNYYYTEGQIDRMQKYLSRLARARRK